MGGDKASSCILLTLPNVTARTSRESATGTLSLEYINSPPTHSPHPNANDREAYIVIHVEGRSFPIDPAIPISLTISPFADEERVYKFRPSFSNIPSLTTLANEKAPEWGSEQDVTLTIPYYSDDVETFDNVLSQYADVSQQQRQAQPGNQQSSYIPQPSPPDIVPPSYEYATDSPPNGSTIPSPNPIRIEGMHVDDPSLRGRLVLMDESNGEVVGELPQRLSFTEDPALSEEDKMKVKGEEASPVVLELPPDVYDAYASAGLTAVRQVGEDLAETREVFVRAIPPEQQDWLTTSATVVSHAISASTSLLLTGIASASNFYISKSKAYTPPPPSAPSSSSTSMTRTKSSSSSTHPALLYAHKLSDKAAKASSVTADYVERSIRTAVGGKSAPPPSSSNNSTRPGTPTNSPPLNTSYAVYTPKTRFPAGPPPPLPPRSPPLPGTPPNGQAYVHPLNEQGQPSPSSPPKPMGTGTRMLMSANLVLATIDDSAKRMFEVGSDRLSAVVGHKYGPQAKQSTHLATHTARNIVLVYVDVSGFARRALITKAGKEWVKTKVGPKDGGRAALPPPPAHGNGNGNGNGKNGGRGGKSGNGKR